MKMFHTIASGKRMGTKVNLLLHGLTAHRKALRREAKAAELAIVISAGQEWYAEGIKLADGNLRPYKNINAAMRGWVSKTYGADWWVDPVKKIEYLQEAASKVSQA
jgi:hypothetical protein